ncbi:HEPN domain-containing protein [Sulfurisphaera ohwakuensis]|uniref:HEPN domain-containing protein n=1 Tax=Sulfurisphaera ohwakuensis TaxID=69656 RepID=A0A650CF14_SULOH|nr:HEPN domain-containing protein [Sulfurisphaera ohwakuensis]MBB5254419.1 HEPN domain-containing protein [Sulfurisphaera ohwakuensis]QGR16346.1 HEPN domain-containing protein [Sulfurisphaera ohwakuensis]
MEEHRNKALEYLNASKLNFEHGFYDIASVLAEEALYLYLVTCLINHEVAIPWYLDFDGLLRILERHDNKISEFRKNRRIIKALDQIRIMFRYSSLISISRDDAKEIISFVESIINSLR